MRIQRFHDGGYVIHKIYLCIHKYSAWFDASGELLDIEAMDMAGNPKRGKVASRAKRIIASMGRVYLEPSLSELAFK